MNSQGRGRKRGRDDVGDSSAADSQHEDFKEGGDDTAPAPESDGYARRPDNQSSNEGFGYGVAPNQVTGK